MKRALIVLAAIVFSGAAHAELKIAVLNTERAIFAAAEVQDDVERANADLKSEQEEVQSLNAEIQSLQEKLQKDAEVMSDEDKRRARKEIEDKNIDLQFLANKLQKELQDKREEILRSMVPKVDAVLKDLIELNGYDFIMERSNFHYVNQKHDITRLVTEKLNERAER